MVISQIHCSLFVKSALLCTCAFFLLSSSKEDNAEQTQQLIKQCTQTWIQPELGAVLCSGLVAAALPFSWEIS